MKICSHLILAASALITCFTSVNAQHNDHHHDHEHHHDHHLFKALPTVQPASVHQQQLLLQTDNWKSFKTDNGSWWTVFNEQTGIPRIGQGKPIPVSGNNEQVIHKMVDKLTPDFNLAENSLLFDNTTRAKKRYNFIHFHQAYQGLEVLYSHSFFRLNDQNEVFGFNLNLHNSIVLNTTPNLTGTQAATLASADFAPSEVTKSLLGPELKVLPVTMDRTVTYQLVYEIVIETVDSETNTPGKYYTLVDAHTGEIAYRYNKIHSDTPPPFEAITQGTVQDYSFEDPYVSIFPNLEIEIEGKSYFTNENGIIEGDIDFPAQATVHMSGLYSSVRLGEGTTTPKTMEVTLTTPNTFISLDDEMNTSERSAYIHVNTVHDFMKSLLGPNFTAMDYPLPTNVDLDGACNAFWNGSSINFFAAGQGCPPTALVSDVVYHEYGHGINDLYYIHLGDNNGFDNGGMHEGYADVWAFLITENPVIGPGFQGDPNSFVRRYDQNPKVYPENLIGQVHNDGEIIAGAFWDLYLNLGKDAVYTSELFAASYLGRHDAPNGDEGRLYSNILLEVLMADDDDNNLANGTPNDSLIADAFAKHGITLLINATIDHEEPLAIEANESATITANVEAATAAFVGKLSMKYRTNPNDDWTTKDLNAVSNTGYETTFEGLESGTIVEYFFEIQDILLSGAVSYPSDVVQADPNLTFKLLVGFNLVERDELAEAGNWITNPDNDDDATTGHWEHGNPSRTTSSSGETVQPSTDHSSSGPSNCWFTANGTGGGVGEADVDAGKTTLQSPSYDLTKYGNPTFAYWRWFENAPSGGANPGNDPFEVYISNNNETWIEVEHTYTADNSWRRNVLRVNDYVESTNDVRLRFVVSDSLKPNENQNGGSLVEAAVDDLALYAENFTSSTTDITTSTIDIYPNPATNQIQIKSSEVAIEKITITDVNGATVLQNTFGRRARKSTISVDIQQLANGIYFLQLNDSQELTKVVKQ